MGNVRKLVDANQLMYLLVMKAQTMSDRHGVKINEPWLLSGEDIEDVLNSIEPIVLSDDVVAAYQQGYDDCAALWHKAIIEVDSNISGGGDLRTRIDAED